MISIEEIHEAFMRQVMRAMAAEAKVKELEAKLQQSQNDKIPS